MGIQTPTVNRESQGPPPKWAQPHPNLATSHDPTSPLIHNFLAGGNIDSQLLAGAIHNLDPSIHTLVHNFWQGKGSNGDLSNRDRHSQSASSPHFTSLLLLLHSHLPVTHHISTTTIVPSHFLAI